MTGNTIPLLHIFSNFDVSSIVAKKMILKQLGIGAGDSNRISVHQRFVEINGKIFSFHLESLEEKKKECQ